MRLLPVPAAMAALVLLSAGLAGTGEAEAQGIKPPSQTAYAPPGGRGRVVLLLSGQSGPRDYKPFAEQLAKLGYYAVLLDGNDVLAEDQRGGDRLQAAIERALASSNASPGKVAVVGYSRGGGAALWYAAQAPERVAGIVAYYPATSWITQYKVYTGIKDIRDYVDLIKVPILMFAGEDDTYENCCLIGTARTMGAAARQRGAPLELVTYPNAKHGFNLNGLGHSDAVTADSWRRTVARLAQYLGG